MRFADLGLLFILHVFAVLEIEGADTAKPFKGIIGPRLTLGEYPYPYQTAFIYAIGRENYLYTPTDEEWVIKELKTSGQINFKGKRGDCLDRCYPISFPYSIGRRTFFYGHRQDTGKWSITELFAGRMGPETDHGKWQFGHHVSVPFNIGGRQFFYAQHLQEKNWFIQELFGNGTMGPELKWSEWRTDYEVVFPFAIDGRQYFYMQNPRSRTWFTQELLPGGEMGWEVDKGTWPEGEEQHAAVPFTIGGKQYFLAANDRQKWMIYELLAGGKMGEKKGSGSWDDKFLVLAPFSIYGRQFIYGYNKDNRRFTTREIL